MDSENVVSVSAIASVSADTITTRAAAASVLQQQRTSISGMGGAWVCNSGRAYVRQMLSQFDEDWQEETLKIMESYAQLLSQASGNYDTAERSNVRNEQSNRSRFHKR